MAAPRVQAAQKQGGGLPGISAGGEGVGGLLQAVVSQCVGFRNDPLRLQGGQVLSEGVQLRAVHRELAVPVPGPARLLQGEGEGAVPGIKGEGGDIAELEHIVGLGGLPLLLPRVPDPQGGVGAQPDGEDTGESQKLFCLSVHHSFLRLIQ